MSCKVTGLRVTISALYTIDVPEDAIQFLADRETKIGTAQFSAIIQAAIHQAKHVIESGKAQPTSFEVKEIK